MQALRILAAAVLVAAGFSAHAVGRLADVQVYDRANGRELPVYWHRGQPYIVGQPGNEYEIVLRNRRGEDLLAVVSVDGVNVLDGRTARTDQGGYVLSRWERLGIRGWRKSLDEVAAFYFTSLGDSYAGRTGRPDNVGVIGVALFQRAAPLPPPPVQVAPEAKAERWHGGAASDFVPPSPAQSNAAPARRMYAQPAAPLGTGHGRREDSHATYVGFERATSAPVETVMIRYDSWSNLVALGVIAQPRPPRQPQAFPGFTPDPA